MKDNIIGITYKSELTPSCYRMLNGNEGSSLASRMNKWKLGINSPRQLTSLMFRKLWAH